MSGVQPMTAVVEPRYESGWFYFVEAGQRSVVAWLRPYSEDWYNFYHFDNWWEALAFALGLTERTPDCEFVGGPPFETDALEAGRAF